MVFEKKKAFFCLIMKFPRISYEELAAFDLIDLIDLNL